MAKTRFDTIRADVKRITWKAALQSLFKEHVRFFVTKQVLDDVSDIKKVILKSKQVAPYSSYSKYKQEYRDLMKRVHPDHNKDIDGKFSTFLGLVNENLQKIPSDVLNRKFVFSKSDGQKEVQTLEVYVRERLDQSVYKGLFTQMVEDADYLTIQNLYDADAAQSMFGEYKGLKYSQRISSEVEKKVVEMAKTKISDGDCEAADEDDITQEEINKCIEKLSLKPDLDASNEIKDSVVSSIESDYKNFIDTQVNKVFLNGYNSPVEFLYTSYNEMYASTTKTYCQVHASVCKHPEIIDSIIADKLFGELLPDSDVIFKS